MPRVEFAVLSRDGLLFELWGVRMRRRREPVEVIGILLRMLFLRRKFTVGSIHLIPSM